MANKPSTPPDFSSFDLLGEFEQAIAPKRVSIVEFCESDEFCNRPLYPRQRVLLKTLFLEELEGDEEDVLSQWIQSSEDKGEVEISPMMRERMAYLKEHGYPHFNIVQFIGGRRSSKGHISGLAMAYKVWNLIQMDDPMTYYGIDRSKEIYVPCLAAKQDQAKAAQFADAYNMITDCKAMTKYISRAGEELVSIYTPADMRQLARVGRNKRLDRDIAKIRVKALGTNAATIRGTASIMAAIDEMAHFLAGESRQTGEEIWGALMPSLRQFDKDYLVFANSSPYTEIGQFFALYEQSKEIDGDFPAYPEHFMMRFPSWQLYEDWETDKGTPWRSKGFKFKKSQQPYESVKDEERKDPDKFAVEYRAHFAKTVDAYLRPEKVYAMYQGNFEGRTLHTTRGGVALFKYKAHGDPSATTANFGIAIGHVEVVHNETTGHDEPHVVFDLIDAFYPSDMTDGVIDWFVVMDTIKGLIRNFRPYEFTFDQFDSKQAIQQLRAEVREQGIADVRIREKTATPAVNKRRWENFKAALYLGRVHAPNPKTESNFRSLELSKNELVFLQERNGKVEKQSIGPVQTKDMADCIAEVVDALIGDTLSGQRDLLGNTKLESGSKGGYHIGGGEKAPRGRAAVESFFQNRPRRMPANPARGGMRRRSPY